nr:hypothetical protein [Tanacetum cinerariifolium]
QMLVNGVADNIGGLVSQGMVDDVMANGVMESVSEGMGRESVYQGIGSGLMANGVSESVPQGVVNGVGVDGVRGNSVSEGMINGGSGLMANGVSESVPQGVVNGVRGNGVSEGMINGARASGVRRSFKEFVSEFWVDGSSSYVGQAADVSATEIDKDHLLACFNQEVHEDLARLRVYRSLANGLMVAVRRRRHRIAGLEALGNCEDAARTVRFWEQMQLDDVEKGTRALLMMKETEAKIGEKASTTPSAAPTLTNEPQHHRDHHHLRRRLFVTPPPLSHRHCCTPLGVFGLRFINKRWVIRCNFLVEPYQFSFCLAHKMCVPEIVLHHR